MKEKVWYVPSQAMTITFCIVVLVSLLGGVFFLASRGGSSKATPSASPSSDPNHLSAFGPSALQNIANAQQAQAQAAQQALQQAQQQVPAGVVLPAGPYENASPS